MEPVVLGEAEALQRFFDSQDVTGVLESSVVVDTSILEQYLSNDMDSFMLPESPPDSSSEPCSPPQIPDLQSEAPHWSSQAASQNSILPLSCHFKEQIHDSPQPRPYTHTPYIRPHAHIYAPPMPLPPSPHLPQHHIGPFPLSGPSHHIGPSPSLQAPVAQHPDSPGLPSSKRRRGSGGEEQGADTSCSEVVSLGPLHTLHWDQYTPEHWCRMYDSHQHTLPAPAYHVEIDKGFLFSAADEAFICQKKNHFQVTIHVGVACEAQYVATPTGPRPIHHLLVRVFGLKMEAPAQTVTIEQSQADRSKKPFLPVRLSLPGDKITKVTLGRLHFSETTANNMRKKGRPNPDQRYFLLAVALYAAVCEDRYMLSGMVSERIIVRASNPGQFESDGDPVWQRGALQEAAVFHGRVGINTDCPDEALVVSGNAKVMGSVLQPSDARAKHNIQEVDSEEQLKRISQMRIVEYDYKPEFASTVGIDQLHQTGILAQEVRKLLPAAVKEVGDIICSDGENIPNFLMVDKEQIFMENVGAVQQLVKLTDNLDGRIRELEGWSQRLAKLRELSGSLRSKGRPSKAPSVSTLSKPEQSEIDSWSKCLHHKIFQATVFTLLASMAFCVISIAALYLFTQREESIIFPENSNDTVSPVQTTAWPSTTPGFQVGPPNINFCELLYCDEVYCCPSTPEGSNSSLNAAPEHLAGERRELRFADLINYGDWTNTTIQLFQIKENQQVIDSRYCVRGKCGPGRFMYRVPISPFVPLNMRITLLMNSTEVLVVHLCHSDESASCSALMEMMSGTSSRYPSNTQGVHEWPLHVARLYHSSFHFRSAVAGQADCSTDWHYAGALFTDYYFYFYRQCTD